MKPALRRIVRVVLLLALTLAVLGVAAPFVNAARFSGSIKAALETSLGRKVSFAQAHFTLFAGPGFSLEEVMISEDPRYGLEPFAHVDTLQARLRLDRLLLGQVRFSSLHMIAPSLNLVKRDDGNWNVVELISRLSEPTRSPVDLFPVVEISDGRIDFKFGSRKTTLYMIESNLAIYPERSGKLSIQFSGSPARTDRAGNGFGHLRGTLNWYLNPSTVQSNQLEADLTLDPSNLSELTTLFQGQDLGVHGTVSSRAHIAGPANALRVSGDLHLEDVHRWDLLPANGTDWHVRYGGRIDMVAHNFHLETAPEASGQTTPVTLEVGVEDLLSRPAWSISAHLDDAPAQDLLPLSRRMGIAVPDRLDLKGTLDGEVGISSDKGLAGAVNIKNVVATLPGLPPLSTDLATATISADHIHFEPATIQASSGGTLQASGDYRMASQTVVASLHADAFPVDAFRRTTESYFGVPAALDLAGKGEITGELVYSREGMKPELWSGDFEFADASLSLPGVALPLGNSSGRVVFDSSDFDLTRFTTTVGGQIIHASYHANPLSQRPGRLRLELHSTDLSQIESLLDPTFRAQSLLSRLGLARRTLPVWLAARNVDGDVAIGQFSVNGTNLGALRSRFAWRGATLQLGSIQVSLPVGKVRGAGVIDVASSSPLTRFTADVTGFPWRGGFLGADGTFQTSGLGNDAVQHLNASGTFTGQDLNLSADEAFQHVSGAFNFSFADGWPSLRLTNLEAMQGEEAWSGEATSESDGKLVFDLEHAGRQRRVISTLEPANPSAASFLLKRP